jgi:hypothetical protein
MYYVMELDITLYSELLVSLSCCVPKSVLEGEMQGRYALKPFQY